MPKDIVVSRDQAANVYDLTADVTGMRIVMVNLYFIGACGGPWSAFLLHERLGRGAPLGRKAG